MISYTGSPSDGFVVTSALDREHIKQNWWQLLSAKEREELIRAQRCQLNLGQVKRIDSAGLAWLINAMRDTKQQGIQLQLESIPDKLIKLAKISDVEDFLTVE